MEPTVPIAFPPPVDRSSWTAYGDIDIQQMPPTMQTGMFQLPPDVDDFTGRAAGPPRRPGLRQPARPRQTTPAGRRPARRAPHGSGVARAAIPERLEKRAARYRAQLADRRVLVAVRIAGARLDAGGRAPLAVLARRLAGEHGRLVELKLRDLGASESMKVHVWPGD